MSIASQVAGVKYRKFSIGHGDDAVTNTLKIMKNMINSGAQNYYVRRWAENIVSGHNGNDISKIQMIFAFLVNHTQYLKDTHGIELLRSPEVILHLLEVGEIPQIDCDDYVLLSLSLLKSIGFPVGMRAVAVKPSGELEHVYGMVFTNKRWMPLDLTKPQYGLGWEYSSPARVLSVEV
ncbi:MAG: hypothetical protein ABIG95_02545 [Candidatus Woesearchaeota archaeon]